MPVPCPVCKGNASVDSSKRIDGDHVWIACPQCGGSFEIGGLFYKVRESEGNPIPHLSAILRHAFEQNQPLPMLTESSVTEIFSR
jgi:hypothetical protein